ncbi:TerB family tellurite resistance protein [Henriciella mobilis]|uniref:tellurite resistance TerB family protein n=1 Tax=Henriciella mobilis TaxID=2305467 RepID=UPI000E66B898|nr:TerB family tellurite resistance protein [Henriciella mobilis]RIJ17557.1 TerB family tellurite resistance protein [Henriciella mobilis]RIJ25455.1 TerB family tellurite resistance protein [Henriciella mobilis]
MLEALKRWFAGRSAPVDRDLDPQVAAAALLVEAALVDGVYANLESDQIAEILLESLGLDADRVDEVLAQGEELAEDAAGAHQFTQHVKKLPLLDRVRVIEGLYRVSLTDGAACKFEEAFIRHVASLLHVDDIRRAQARRRAESRQPQ